MGKNLAYLWHYISLRDVALRDYGSMRSVHIPLPL